MRIAKLIYALILCVGIGRAESDIPEDFPEDPNFAPVED